MSAEPRPIVAVTGGRDVRPSAAELRALVSYLREVGCVVLRHGDEPRGVDRAVARAVRGRGTFRVSAWPAAWERLRKPAGPRRNRAMLRGDLESEAIEWPDGPERGGGPFESRGPVHALVHWPGGPGTADCVAAARRMVARGTPLEIVAIGDLVQRWEASDGDF